ncbi:hypothetical protein D187_008737 [Cystobacter fuscus DSM 2262]|uniref:Uncharacterized protein n=1 Tax=Cystobacter fuscus (strain ATCC 25194 / DSM 2262 / NBRC 100088 / M29) TaxID=1242864 RepID=S9QMR3_CYSF2|nr:hypothetical protein [Cystobacter fuscus]EPX62549.1 hypothetical protein D187_008737 [Cystobacter fuscus DSM 2262]
MSDVDTIKRRLLNAPWREYIRRSVEAEGGAIELVIRRPPDAVLEPLLRDAKAQRLDDEGAEEKRVEDVLRFRARVVATCVFLPNAVTSLFTPEEAYAWPGLVEVADACMAAIMPAKALENARGN